MSETIEVTYADGSKESVLIREMPVRDWPRAYELADADDEFGLIDHIVASGSKPGWSMTLTPESFYRVAEKVTEVNLPFMKCAVRRGTLRAAKRSHVEAAAAAATRRPGA